jgi:hypothetical protein
MANVSLTDGDLASASTALQCSNSSLVQQGGQGDAAFTRSGFNWGLVVALVGNLLFWVGLFLLF